MELIAAAQIPRSLARIVANRPYRDGMRRVVLEAALGDPAGAAKLLATPDHVTCAMVLVITGDRGLSGSYNNSSLRAAERLAATLQREGTRVRLVCVGKKASNFFRFRGLEVEESFSGFLDRPLFADAQRIARHIATPYLSGDVQKVLLVSTRYLSAASQGVEVQQLLPLVVPELVSAPSTALKGYTEFEPEVEKLLYYLAPRALESEIFSALLEGAASFHASQQRAMAAATDHAAQLGHKEIRRINRAPQATMPHQMIL
jgi:F-type H+-transporting ATPase subunit gamma